MSEITADDPTLSMTNRPTPGQGLTADPAAKPAHRKPPKHNRVNEAITEVFADLTSKKKLPALTKILKEEKVYLDVIASAIIEQNLLDGKYNVDVAHLMVEPILFTLMWVASQVGAPVSITGADYYDSSGMDILGKRSEKKAEQAVESLLAPEE